MKLREYQQEAIDEIIASFCRQENYVLFQAATGAGKTIVLSHLIKHCQTKWDNIKILVLAHRSILITQTQDKLLAVWPEADIGIACASVQKDKNIDAPIVIASIQSIYNRTDLPTFDLVIIDECHRLPEKSKRSMYGHLLDGLLIKKEKLRILGLTATPYRLGQGYIYGGDCKKPEDNWFPKLNVQIDIRKLQEEKFLCEYKYWLAIHDIPDDIKNVAVSAGEYDMKEAGDIMSKPKHLMSIIKTLRAHAENRAKVVLFCTTISHAEKVKEIIEENFGPCNSIHSNMSDKDRVRSLDEFHFGDVRFLTNVNVLTEGWDFPELDCVVLCRPTKSTALYVQMVGRCLRIAEGKTDSLVLDLVDCYSDHGSIKKPKVSHAVDRDIEGEAPEKLCENCGAICHLAVKECPECGYVFPVKEIEDNANKKLVQVDTSEKFYCKSCDKQYYMEDLDTVLTSNKAYSARCPIGHELSANRFAKCTEAMPLTTVGHKFHETVSRNGNQMILLNYYGRNGMCHYLVDFYYVLSVPWALEKYLRIKNNIPAHINVRFENGYAKARGL